VGIRFSGNEKFVLCMLDSSRVLLRQENHMTNVKLFNSAYKLAWDQLQSDPELLAKPSGLAKRLNDQVQKLLKDSNSPQFIAIEAVARLKA
jgi:hypothetical protein